MFNKNKTGGRLTWNLPASNSALTPRNAANLPKCLTRSLIFTMTTTIGAPSGAAPEYSQPRPERNLFSSCHSHESKDFDGFLQRQESQKLTRRPPRSGLRPIAIPDQRYRGCVFNFPTLMLEPPLPTGQVSPGAVASTTLKVIVPDAVPPEFPIKTPAQASLTVLPVAVLLAPLAELSGSVHSLSR
jgi:hypothetical protein